MDDATSSPFSLRTDMLQFLKLDSVVSPQMLTLAEEWSKF